MPDSPNAASNAVPKAFDAAWQGLLTFLDQAIQFHSARPVGGACINRCHAVHTDQGCFFLKQQDRFHPGFFAAEAAGLAMLRRASGTLRIPKPLVWEDHREGSWLWMEWLESGSRKPDADAVLGQELAQMHRQTAAAFGRPGESGPFYLALLEQDNGAVATGWADFFRRRRLPALMQACGPSLPFNLARRLEVLALQLDDRVAPEAPALIHGDLWSGNALLGPEGYFALVDPAPLYGHRESDLAMMRLFGGFADRTFSAYQAAFPLQAGWEERIGLFQVEPLLVHVALFGEGYLGQLKALLDRLKV